MPSEKLQVILELTTGQYKKEAREAATATGQIGKAASDSGASLTRLGSTLTSRVTLPILALGGAAIKAASDLGESVNAVNVVFGTSAKTIHDWGETAAESAGISQRAFNQAATVLGSSLKNAGLDVDEVADKTIVLTQRAADMASVFNTDVNQALGAIQAALRGETDPIEKFGVSLSAAAVDAKAAALGFKTVGGEFDTTAKSAARMALIMEQTEQVAGDFANTADGLANSSRILKARLEDTAAELGEALLPIATDMVEVLLGLVEGFSDLSPEIKTATLAILGLAAATGPALTILGNLKKILGAGALGAGAGLTGAAVAVPAIGAVAAARAGLFKTKELELLDRLFEDVDRRAEEAAAAAEAAAGPIDAFTSNAFLMGKALGDLPRGVFDTRDSLRDDLIPALQDARAEFDLDPTSGFAERLRDDLGPALTETATSAFGVGSGLEALREGARTARDPVQKLSDALRDAAANQRSLAQAVLEFVSPIVAAVGATKRLVEAETAVADLQRRGKGGTEEWAEAMLELAVAKGEAQAALDSLDSQGIETTASALARLLQIPREEAEKLLEVLGLINDQEVSVVIDIKVPRDVASILEGLSGEVSLVGNQARQHGGPVSAGQPYVVGERGPELFIPQQGGAIMPNGWTRPNGPVINVNHPNTANLAQDLQLATILASVTTMVERQ